MTIGLGARVGPYEVTALIGVYHFAGGILSRPTTGETDAETAVWNGPNV